MILNQGSFPMATFATKAAPDNAIKIWCDARWIYIELKTKLLEPACVMSFTRDSAGLSKALAIIYGHADNSGSAIAPKQPRKNSVQSALAESILRRQGLIK